MAKAASATSALNSATSIRHSHRFMSSCPIDTRSRSRNVRSVPNRRKTLRLDPDQARTLAIWLRYAAERLEQKAKEMEGCVANPGLGEALRHNARGAREEAERARALANRLVG
jgi:hypothetical protein